MSSSRRSPTGLALATLVSCLGGCDGPPQASETLPDFVPCRTFTAPDEERLAVEDGAFVVAGAAALPHAVNSYPLLEHVGNGELDAVRDILDQARALGRPILRTNAFLDVGDNPARLRDDDGTLREEGLPALDTLIAEAADRGVRLILLLTNNWEDYGGAAAVVAAVAPGEALPKDAFWSLPRAVEAQAAYERGLAARENPLTGEVYGRDPTIAGWELANEARCETAAWCDEGTLARWAATMAAALREAGATQPIFWGGAGVPGAHGEDLEDIATRGGVDVLTLHLYLDHSHPEIFWLPADARVEAAIALGARLIREGAAVATRHGLPLVLEEFGWDAPEEVDRDEERAAIFRGWLAVAHDLDLATAPWMIGEHDRPDYDGFLIPPDAPRTNDVLRCRP